MAKSKPTGASEDVVPVDPEFPAVPPEQPGGGASEEQKPPPYGAPEPAGDGPLPRVVGERARASEGTQRFKIACRNYDPQPVRYILAKTGDEAGARACYLKTTGLAAKLDALKKNGVTPEPPALVVTALKD